MQNQLPVGEAIVAVICASNKTQLIDFSRNQHACPLYLMIGNNRKIICQIPKTIAWIPVGGFPVLPTGGNNTEVAWHSAIGSVLRAHRNFDITGPSLKWNFADGFQGQSNPLLAD
jgi:hypothetical protein